MVPGPVRIQDGPGTILLTSRFSGDRSVNYLGYSWISRGGDGLIHFVSSGTNHARKEPDPSRDPPVTLLHCSIRTRRIRTVLTTRRAQRGSPAQGWRVRTAAGIRPANPFLAWIHGSSHRCSPDRAARFLNRSREDRKTSLQPARSPSRAPVRAVDGGWWRGWTQYAAPLTGPPGSPGWVTSVRTWTRIFARPSKSRTGARHDLHDPRRPDHRVHAG